MAITMPMNTPKMKEFVSIVILIVVFFGLTSRVNRCD